MRKLASILLCCTLLLSVCAGCQGSDVLSWQDMYDLGVRYLEEGKIDEAIIAFQTAMMSGS